jgi:hypothetical protein
MDTDIPTYSSRSRLAFSGSAAAKARPLASLIWQWKMLARGERDFSCSMTATTTKTGTTEACTHDH